MTKQLKFRDLHQNESFDWVDPTPGARNSFFDRCYKTGPRTYRAFGTERSYRVGSINASVFHVGLLNSWFN